MSAANTPIAHPPPHRIISPFTEEEAHEIQNRLDTKLDASHLSYRPAAQGTVAYLEGWKAFNLANEVFGFNGWSSEILGFTIDFTDIDVNGKISLGMSCMVRIHLKDGTYHDDIGYGSADNQKSKSAAYEKAKKEAVTDGMKRALRMFGNRLGNCAYDKNFLKDVKNGRSSSSSTSTAILTMANYPKVTAVMPQLTTPPITVNSHYIPPPPPSSSSNTITSRPSVFDESMFENSMMISEEDLIIDDNFSHLTADEAVIMEREENRNNNNSHYNAHATSYTKNSNYSRDANSNIYPLLPNKRR